MKIPCARVKKVGNPLKAFVHIDSNYKIQQGGDLHVPWYSDQPSNGETMYITCPAYLGNYN